MGIGNDVIMMWWCHNIVISLSHHRTKLIDKKMIKIGYNTEWNWLIEKSSFLGKNCNFAIFSCFTSDELPLEN